MSTTVPLASLPRCRFYHGAACLPRCRVYHGALTDGDTVCQRELFGTIAAEPWVPAVLLSHLPTADLHIEEAPQRIQDARGHSEIFSYFMCSPATLKG